MSTATHPPTYREALAPLFGGVPDAAAMVIERGHESHAEEMTKAFGGGWRGGFQIWKGLPTMPFLVLAAYCPERLEQRNPLMMTACDLSTLRRVLELTCQQLDDVQCGWVHLLSSEAKRVVTEVILRDANPAGAA